MANRDSPNNDRRSPGARRALGDAPTLGPVAKATPRTDDAIESPPVRIRARSHRPVAAPSKILGRWLILLLGIAGIAFVGMVVWILAQQKPAQASSGNHWELETAATTSNTPVAPTSEEAMEIVGRMLAATSAADLEPLIRSGGVSPEVALDFLARSREIDGTPLELQWIGPSDSLLLPLEFVAVPYDSGRNRLAMLTPDANGDWRIDFDAFMGRNEPSLDKLLAGDSDRSEVRVLAVRDNYYNGIFGDDSEWLCISLVSPDHDELNYAYLRRGSPQEAAFMAIERRLQIKSHGAGQSKPGPATIARVVLAISRPEDAGERQFEIDSVIADDWVIADRPLDVALLEGDATE